MNFCCWAPWLHSHSFLPTIKFPYHSPCYHCKVWISSTYMLKTLQHHPIAYRVTSRYLQYPALSCPSFLPSHTLTGKTKMISVSVIFYLPFWLGKSIRLNLGRSLDLPRSLLTTQVSAKKSPSQSILLWSLILKGPSAPPSSHFLSVTCIYLYL